MRKYLLIMALSIPLTLLGGDPIPGIDITVNQAPGNIVVRSRTDTEGTAILSGLQPGPCLITLNHKGRITVIGRSAEDLILMPDKDKSPAKPIRMDLYPAPEPRNDQALQKKEAGKTEKKAITGKSEQEVPVEKAAKEEMVKGDCREVVEITPMTDGRLEIQVTCED